MKYTAKILDKNNKIKIITEEHNSKEIFISHLLQKNYKIINVKKQVNFFSFLRGNRFNKYVFLNNIYNLMSSGLSLKQSIITLNKYDDNYIYETILEKLEEGEKFSDILMQTSMFKPIEISFIKTGEESGKFIDSLKILISYSKKMNSLKKKIYSMIMYPVFLIFFFLMVSSYILLIVFPKIYNLYSDLGVEKTDFIVIIYNAVSFFKNNILIILFLFVISILLLIYIIRKKKLISTIIIKIPFVKNLYKNHLLFLFLNPFIIMIKQGIYLKKIVSSLKSSFYTNKVLLNLLNNIDENINRGIRLSDILCNSNIFNEKEKEMIKISEETSKFLDILEIIKNNNEEEYENNLKIILSILEPLIIIAIGVLVLLFVIIFIIPIMNLSINV